MVSKFGLENNNWIQELYGRKNMWAAAHIRLYFFARIRTTSHFEGLHSHIDQFVHSRITLTDFVKQFNRCLSYFLFKELETNLQSDYGDVVL